MIRSEELLIAASLIASNNPTITTYNLKTSECTDREAKELARSLETNTHLTTLDISKNNITDEGALAFADAIRKNKTLQKFIITDTDIGVIGAQHILEALKTNKTLTEVRICSDSEKESEKWNTPQAKAILQQIENLTNRNKERRMPPAASPYDAMVLNLIRTTEKVFAGRSSK